MAVTNDEVSALEAYLSASSGAEAADAERHLEQLVSAGAANNIGALLYAALAIAARRIFAPAWTSADIVRFVASVRTEVSEGPDVIDPHVAEMQLRQALGAEQSVRSDQASKARTQLVLLVALLHRLDLRRAELIYLLEEGRALADQLAGGQPQRQTS